MVWNPLDLGAMTDPRRNAWRVSDEMRVAREKVDEKRHEVWRAITPPAICLAAVIVAFHGNRNFTRFWLGEPGWAAVLQVVAIVSAVVLMVRLGIIAVRRYGASVVEEGMPPVPLWFRGLLAAMELGATVALLGALLTRIFSLEGRETDVLLVRVAVCVVLTVSHVLIRWQARSYGWIAERIFWSRNDV